jgi:hypothetical protein
VAKVASKYENGDSCSDSRYPELDCTLKSHFYAQSNKIMNTKQTAPLIATLVPALISAAPILLIGGAAFLALRWLWSDEEKEKKPEAAPENVETERRRKAAEIALETSVFRQIPAEICVKPTAVPVPSARVAPSPPVPAAPKAPLLVPAPAIVPVIKTVVQNTPPPPVKRKFVTREDLATVFQRGARALTRTAAVAILKNLGFGKTAAYDALSMDGRFSAWLQFAPDGIITWKG